MFYHRTSYLFLVDHVRDSLEECGLVHLVREFRYHDGVPFRPTFCLYYLHVSGGTNRDSPVGSRVQLSRSSQAHDAACFCFVHR